MANSSNKVACVLGCTGQIGSHFADFLLEKGLEVYGVVRRVSSPNYKNIEHILDHPNFYIEEGDITDLPSLIEIFSSVKPNYIINQAAQSHVGTSFKEPLHTITTTGLGAINIFEAARICCPGARIYHASTSELFSGLEYPQNENTKLEPKSPYGIAKLLAHEGARIYNESYGMFICTGICFNMEGPRRGVEFVTQKIVDAVVRQVCGEDIVLELGNMEAKRDWQHAKDAVEAQWLMLNQDTPQTYVIASGETHSIFEFVNAIYSYFGIEIIWITKDGLPVGYDMEGKVLVKSVDKYYRPNEVNCLLGDASKARNELGWKSKYDFNSLIEDMVVSKLNEYTHNY